MPISLTLPDILSAWPWERIINAHYSECRRESEEWFRPYKLFPPKQQTAIERCDPSLLASLAFPNVSKEGCRVICDLMFLFVTIDEHSDKMDPRSVQLWVDIIVDVLHNPRKSRPQGEPIIGEVVQSFWLNAINTVSASSQKRFLEEFEDYLRSLVTQAKDRESESSRDVESYMILRRLDLGAKPTFPLLCMEFDFPEHAFGHPAIVQLQDCVVDMLILANDMWSFNVEQSQGDNHNIVPLVMLEYNLTLQDAMNHLAAQHEELAKKFLSIYTNLPSFGSATDDFAVARFVESLGNWIRANDSFSFECCRYFGYDGPTIQKTRVVELLPGYATGEEPQSLYNDLALSEDLEKNAPLSIQA